MAKTLTERLKVHEQQKARLAEAEAKLKLDERRQRTRRLVEAGAMLEKTGLSDLPAYVLYGALRSLRTASDDPAQVERWAADGERAFAVEAVARDEGKEAVLLTFATPIGKDVTVALRRAGFRYSKVMLHWEGMAKPGDARALATAHGGSMRSITSAASGAAVANDGIADAATENAAE